jgi:hypothetical protein
MRSPGPVAPFVAVGVVTLAGSSMGRRRLPLTASLIAWLLLPGGALVRAADPEDAALDNGAVRLEGRVHDAQGAPAPAVRVVAAGRQARREASSEADGSFVIESLPPGVYTIQAVGSGASSQPTRVTIDPGVEPAPLVLVLEAAEKVEQITVTAGRALGTHPHWAAAALLTDVLIGASAIVWRG